MATTKLWTVEELERVGVPEGRWELVDGELVEMAPSGGDASWIGARFVRHLGNHVDPLGLGRVYGSDAGFVLTPGRPLLRVPDAAFVRGDRLPSPEEHRGFLRLAPDLAVEVLSPTDRMADVLAKVAEYLGAGVRLIWLADPPSRTVTAYTADQPIRVLSEGEELDGGDVLPDFRIAVAELFA